MLFRVDAIYEIVEQFESGVGFRGQYLCNVQLIKSSFEFSTGVALEVDYFHAEISRIFIILDLDHRAFKATIKNIDDHPGIHLQFVIITGDAVHDLIKHGHLLPDILILAPHTDGELVHIPLFPISGHITQANGLAIDGSVFVVVWNAIRHVGYCLLSGFGLRRAPHAYWF